MKNLWILTEERPKKEVIITIIKKFAEDRNMIDPIVDQLRILPILEKGRFTFRYRVVGISCQEVNEVFLEVIRGASSFVDFLIFHQDERPSYSDQPIYAIEETKTDDSESRNTGSLSEMFKVRFYSLLLSAYQENYAL